MRNLKKFLALVMAMVMAFSLMLTASAANTAKDFDDADSITEAFIEATDVLTGMKVFQGDGDGFYPGRNINRAEVAALIYRLATGDVDDVRAGTYANYGNFTDVSESDWFAGYVGFCANAGYIKGRSATTFDPYASVTGYEALAMILRAIGYDKNGEFTGPTWETNVSALATQLGILTNIKTTHYGNTLYLASRRDVVAELLFQADAKVPMVVYTPAFGYQQTGMDGGVVGTSTNPTLGKHIFGLALSEDGILLGNQQTGETGSVMGYAGNAEYYANATDTTTTKKAYTAYTWAGFDSGLTNAIGSGKVLLGNNVKYELETGIDLIGHKLKLWFDDGSGVVSGTKKHVYAYFDEADTAVIEANNTDLSAPAATGNIAQAIKDAGFKLNSGKDAVWNDSFGKFDLSNNRVLALDGSGIAHTGASGWNPHASPVNLYKIIDNDDDKVVDAIIALNIESSQVTESNNVNRVPTLGLPVENFGGATVGTNGSLYVLGNKTTAAGTPDENLKSVSTVITGVIAQDAVVGNSTKTLGDYEMGIHITGTTPRTVSANEKAAINGASNGETARFLLNKVTATKEGTVVAYNVDKGTVTLDDGTVLERSKFYDTVVVKNRASVSANVAPNSAIPQAWASWDGSKWVEGYANATYKFYTDYEGKYLGAERSFGTTFLYGTYLDYSQETSSSTFNYYLTGVDMNGEIKTVPVSKFWDNQPNGTASPVTETKVDANNDLKDITGTDLLKIPFRDTAKTATNMNGIGTGWYRGFAIQGTTVDGSYADNTAVRNEYLNNMARLGIKWGNDTTIFNNNEVAIGKDAITLGAVETYTTVGAGSNKYFTEATKFILVSGIGTDSVKAEVYTGISELKGTASSVIIDMKTAATATAKNMKNITGTVGMADMTYYTESPYTYAQSGQTAMKVDTIILPKAAVTWTGGTNLYYVGNPTPSLVNSYGEDAWKYTMYLDGEEQQVWLTNDPNGSALGTNDKTTRLERDSFYNLRPTGNTANDGQPIYTAGQYGSHGKGSTFTAGAKLDAQPTPVNVPGTADYMSNQRATGYATVYSAMTRDAQTATFYQATNATPITLSNGKLFNVANAKVVNLNKDAKAGFNSDGRAASGGEIWPGITDLATLNEAGSINPVTGRALKVAAVVDPANPLIVTCIYVCWDQTID